MGLPQERSSQLAMENDHPGNGENARHEICKQVPDPPHVCVERRPSRWPSGYTSLYLGTLAFSDDCTKRLFKWLADSAGTGSILSRRLPKGIRSHGGRGESSRDSQPGV